MLCIVLYYTLLFTYTTKIVFMNMNVFKRDNDKYAQIFRNGGIELYYEK